MAKAQEKVTVRKPNIKSVTVPVYSLNRLVVNNFSERPKIGLRESVGVTEKTPRAKGMRDPESEFLGTLYPMDKKKKPTKTGFPACAFKKAMVRAAKNLDGMCMKDTNSILFVRGVQFGKYDLVEIKGKYDMREDVVRVNKSTDLRYRAEYPAWCADVVVDFNADMITKNQVVALLDQAGHFVGIGENRHEKSGDNWGRFTVIKPRGWRL